MWLMLAPPAVGVFAVEDTTAQFVWRSLPEGPLTLRVAGRSTTINSTGGPGAYLIDDLEPGRAYHLELTGRGMRGEGHHESFTTLQRPPGEQLQRIATMNDLHIGVDYFGVVGTMRDRRPSGLEPTANRCARLGMEQLLDWQPDHLVFKGDIVHAGKPAEWELARSLLEPPTLPPTVTWDIVLGNHELKSGEGVAVAEVETWGYDASEPVRVRDLPGIRLVLVETAVHGSDRGFIADKQDQILTAASEADRPVLIMMHHNLQRQDPPWMLPFGIRAAEAKPLLDALDVACPGAIVTSGHTHRHRRRAHRSINVIEVGSTKDFPGTWCGMDIYEGGMRQVVRRIVGPDVLPWLDRTRHAAGTAWGRWSPGTIDDRCFTLRF